MISANRRRLVMLAMTGAMVWASACETPTASRPAPAYDPTLLTGGVLYRWTSGATVRVFVVDGDAAGNAELAAAVRQAISVWNSVRQFNEYTLTLATSISEAEIIVLDRTSALPVLPGSCTFDPRSSSGYTYFCPDNGVPQRAERLRLTTGPVSTASVVIRLDRGRTNSVAAFNAVVAHEFGHALGIGAHSDITTDLMFGLPSVETPSSRDAGTLRFLLGRPADLTL